MKFLIRTIPAAAAMTAALMFGGAVHAQTAGQPTTGSGDRTNIPAGPNDMGGTPGKTMQQRNAVKPMAKPGMEAGATATGGGANIPAGPNTTSKTMEQRDAAKPMAKQGAMAGSTATGDSAAMPPGGADQPVRQSGKVAKNKAERMEKGNGQRTPMSKSNEPVRESDLKDAPTK